MASQNEDQENLVYDIRLTSVGPRSVTGGDVIYEPSDMDLAMKLQYIRTVHFFRAEVVRDFTVRALKDACFIWHNYYYEACGRFRRAGVDGSTGRPYVKCSDCGIRFVEAKSSKTLDQWLDMVKFDPPFSFDDETHPHRLLIPNQILGPELVFSPLVLLQVTFLKCGGISLGMSFSHVLGDAFSATKFINVWSQILSGNIPTHSPNLAKSSTYATSNNNGNSKNPKSSLNQHPPLSVKITNEPVGDRWIVPDTCTMYNFSFHITPAKLAHIQSKFTAIHN